MPAKDLTAIRGVGETTARKLMEAGITSPEEVATAELTELVIATGFPESRAAAIRESAAALLDWEEPSGNLEEPAEKSSSEAGTEEKPKKKKKSKKKSKKKGKKKDRQKKEKSKKKKKNKAEKKKKGKKTK